jgi:hypothetical protein
VFSVVHEAGNRTLRSTRWTARYEGRRRCTPLFLRLPAGSVAGARPETRTGDGCHAWQGDQRRPGEPLPLSTSGGVGDRASRDVLMDWSRPVSRVLFALRRDSHSSRPHVTVRLKQPTREQRGPRYRSPIRSCSGWGLPCHAALSPRAVRSYRTVSPLPDPLAGPSAVCSLLHWPSARAAQALPGTLPCGARTFLDAHKARRDCPADSNMQFS